jgi:hypothetical protein
VSVTWYDPKWNDRQWEPWHAAFEPRLVLWIDGAAVVFGT